MELGFLTPRWFLVHAISLSGFVLLAFMWFRNGPNSPLYGLLFVSWTLNLGLVASPLALHVPDWLFRVPASEHAFHRLLGIPLFRRILDLSGWNRHVALPWRAVNIGRANLPRLRIAICVAAGSHAIAFMAHLSLASLALFCGQVSGALWLLMPGIAVHLYPVLLQRSLLLRLQPLLGVGYAVKQRS